MIETTRKAEFAEMLKKHKIATYDDGMRVRRLDTGELGIVWAESTTMFAVDLDNGITLWASRDKFEAASSDLSK
jgi:hypothetical protein